MHFKNMLTTIRSENADYGRNNVGNGDGVAIDFSSPIIVRLFHVGHYTTTTLDNFIKNLMQNSGYNVTALKYLGGWGKQSGLVLLGFEVYGSAEELEKHASKHLFKVHVKIIIEADEHPELHDKARNVIREMEELKNEKYLALWERFRETSNINFKKLCKS